jgi:hypothetical protein
MLAHPNLGAAIAAGEPSETLLAGIRERERRQKDLRAELAALEAGPSILAGADAIRREALRLLDDWRGLLGRHVATSRQLLRKVLDRERFVFYPASAPALKKAGMSPTGSAPGGNAVYQGIPGGVGQPGAPPRPVSCRLPLPLPAVAGLHVSHRHQHGPWIAVGQRPLAWRPDD